MNTSQPIQHAARVGGFSTEVKMSSHIGGKYLTRQLTLEVRFLARKNAMHSLAGTQIGVPTCFTEYPQPFSLAANLWIPCCPCIYSETRTIPVP